MLLSKKMKKFRILVHEKYVDSLILDLGKQSLAHIDNLGPKIKNYEGLLEEEKHSDLYYRIFNLKIRVEKVQEQLEMKWKKPSKSKDGEYARISDEHIDMLDNYLKEIEDKKNELLSKKEAIGKDASEEEQEVKSDKKVLKKKIEEADKEIEAYSNEITDFIHNAKETLENETQIEEILSFSGKTKTTRVFEGWVIAKNEEKFDEKIASYKEGVAIEWLEVAKTDKKPTSIKNPDFLSGFEGLVRAFGTPNSEEIDPTILVAITFPFIFGMMFGDLGHGFLLLLVGIVAYIFSKKPGPKGEIVGYFTKGSILLIFSAIFSMFFGLMYGECFGWDIIHEPWYIDIVHQFGPLIDLTGLKPGGHNEFLWFSPTENPIYLFKMSIYVAVVHINLGLLINVINNIKKKKIAKAIFGPLCWMWFYIGAWYIIFPLGYGIDVIFWLNDLTGNPTGSPLTYLLVLPLLLMLIGSSIVEMKHLGNVVEGFTEGMLYAFEAFIESLSNTISYGRILALSVVHATFSKTFLTLGGSNTHVFLSIPMLTMEGDIMALIMFIGLFVIGTGFVMVLEGLLTFFQSLRLIWVEFFLKFYIGDGIDFNPVILKQEYSPINFKELKNYKSKKVESIEVLLK
ncbi:MAG: V-type ATPase 116kDa subunit family protein [Candidatus Ranarchaeia archaeon]